MLVLTNMFSLHVSRQPCHIQTESHAVANLKVEGTHFDPSVWLPSIYMSGYGKQTPWRYQIFAIQQIKQPQRATCEASFKMSPTDGHLGELVYSFSNILLLPLLWFLGKILMR